MSKPVTVAGVIVDANQAKCRCGHVMTRHFVSWDRKVPGACLCIACECRAYREANEK